MDIEFINLTTENLTHEHLCCIIRSRKPYPNIDAKRQWLLDRLREGHVFRKLNAKATVFIEYTPLRTARVPVIDDSYYHLYCLWVSNNCKGEGCGESLMEYCLDDAKAKGKSGAYMPGAKKQEYWLSGQASARKYGFEVADTTGRGYELLALSLDGTRPRSAQNVRSQETENRELTIYYDMQCPYIRQNTKIIEQYYEQNDIPVSLIYVDTLQRVRELPCAFNNWTVFYKGKFKTVNSLLDIAGLERIFKK